MLNDLQKQKLKIWEQVYFSIDEPVPFKKKFKIYPILARDYYKFYTVLQCLTLDKTSKEIIDEDGKRKKVSNPQGIGMSYLQYLISEIEQDNDYGKVLSSYLTTILEMCLHIKNGLYCPKCGKGIITYDEITKNLENTSDEERVAYFQEHGICKECNCVKREIFSIKDSGKIKKLSIYDTELSPQDFDELIVIITHQNILDYQADKYIDPELKEEMELKARLENDDYTAASLERQLTALAISTSYKLEELKDLPMRRITYMLRLLDKKNSYYCQLNGLYSGMVKFKESPKHWLFSEDSNSLSKKIMTLDDVNKKFEHVT